MSLLNRCIFAATSSGTGNFVVSAAATGFLTPAQSGAVDGLTYSYAAELTSGGVITAWEVGQGVYHSGTVTLDRTTVLFSSNANAVVSFASAPNVMITALKEDFKTLNNAETVTTSKPILDLSQTWNASGVAFTALKLNITNTASAAGSSIMQLLISSAVDNASVAKTISFKSDNSEGWTWSGGSVHRLISAGANPVSLGWPTGVALGSTQTLCWGTNQFDTGGSDTFLFRDAGGILAQRNSANAQTFRVYNTTDSGINNYERGVFDWTTSSNTLTIGAQALGTGTLRSMTLVGAGLIANMNNQLLQLGTYIYLNSNSLVRLQYNGGDTLSIGPTALFGAGVQLPLATKTADYTLTTNDHSLIFNKASTATLTLLAASGVTGFTVLVKTITANTVVSASSNVVPAIGGSATTAILPATAGKWAILQSDGTNWQIMASN